MKDLITRWEATEVVYKALRMPAPDYKKDPFHDSYSLAISMVRQIPSAQQWVPVTERLPEKHQYVLVTYKGLDGRRLVVVTNWNPNTWIESNSIAWMPVPEPYKEADG